MRTLLLPLLMASLGAAEPIPALELTWDGVTRPTLAQPIAAWWDQALVEAARWWEATSGARVDPAALLAGCRGVHLIGCGVPSDPGAPAPWAAGWWDGADASLAAGVRTVVADWPGCTAGLRDGRLELAAPGIVAAPTAPPPPGVRMVLHGDAVVAACSTPDLLPPDLAPYLRPLIACLRGWRLSAGVGADGRGWIESGLPARWLAAPDPEVIARLPRDAIASAVIALDGAALAQDAPALQAMPSEATIALMLARSDLAGAVRALGGTWAVALTGESAGIACIPRSPVLDRLAGLWLASLGVRLPAEGASVALGEGLHLACAPRWWLVADRPAAIAAFLAPPAPAAATDDAMGWAHATGAAAAGWLAWIPDEAAAQWPLPEDCYGLGTHADDMAAFHGWMISGRHWRDRAAELAGIGDHRLALAAVGGRIRVELDGPLLPWVLPGLAVRGFADHVQDCCGRSALRRHLAARQAAGEGALPGDLVALVPEVDADRLHAALELLRALAAVPDAMSAEDSMSLAGSAYVPLPDAGGERAVAAKEWVELSAPLEDPDFPAGSTIAVRNAHACDILGFEMPLPALGIDEAMARNGRELALHGDRAGVRLAERARRLARDPLRANELLFALRVQKLRDDAWLIAGLSGALPPAELEAWAAEPPPTITHRYWLGERLIMAQSAASWLALPATAAAPYTGFWRLMAAPGIWQGHFIRGRTAQDLVWSDQFLFHLQDPSRPLPRDWRMPGSPVVTLSLPRFAPLDGFQHEAGARHALMRLAWRLHRLAQQGALPADAAAAEAAVGPLRVAYADAALPLRYRRRGAGFSLELDPGSACPPSVQPWIWALWTSGEPPSADAHLVLPRTRLEVVIDPRAPGAGGGQAGDF